MYYSFFGRCFYPRSRTCNSFHHPLDPQTNTAGRCASPRENGCPPFDADKRCEDNLFIKSTALGGVVLPDGTEKRATYNVASLTLDTSDCTNYLVQLVFSCNIITSELKVRMRFQLFRQARDQCFLVPVSAGILYYRHIKCSEANSFTLSACDCVTSACTSYNYSACVEVEEMEPGGSLFIANPVIIATISKSE